jgi:hypothetical protein
MILLLLVSYTAIAGQTAAAPTTASAKSGEMLNDSNGATKNLPKKIGSDTNGDGTPDRYEYYEGGLIVKAEADGNGDGKMDELAYFKDGKMIKIEKDSDFDGKTDKWVEY